VWRSDFGSGYNVPSTIIPTAGQFFPHSLSATGPDCWDVFEEDERRLCFADEPDDMVV
jgi:hypothetical protein